MKVLISHIYSSDNKGDAALLSVLIRDIRRQFGSTTEITLLTLDNTAGNDTFEGLPLKPSFMYYAHNTYSNRLLKLLNSTYIIVSTMLWARLHKLNIKFPIDENLLAICEEYASSDMVIAVGGGYLRSNRKFASMADLLLMLHPISFMNTLDKPTFLYTMSIGPLFRTVERRLVAHYLKKIPAIFIRENKSLKLLHELGIRDNVIRSIDSGFQFSSEQTIDLREKLNIDNSCILLGITARKWLDDKAQKKYEIEMACAIDAIMQKYDIQVVFIPQVTSKHHGDDDRIVNESIRSRMVNKKGVHTLTGDYNHFEIKAMYNELNYIIGTRFHSVIFSLTSYVPAIAIEYEHKTSGIMQDLGIEKWSIKIEDVTSQGLIVKFDKLFAENDDYIHHLHEVLPAYVSSGQLAISTISELYDKLSRS